MKNFPKGARFFLIFFTFEGMKIEIKGCGSNLIITKSRRFLNLHTTRKMLKDSVIASTPTKLTHDEIQIGFTQIFEFSESDYLDWIEE